MKQLSLSLILKRVSQFNNTGNLPTAIVRLTNEDSKMVIVNRRLLFVPEGYPKQIGEINFSIIGPPAGINLKLVSVNAGKAGAEFFFGLNLREFVEKAYDLNNYFRFNIPGKYIIRAIYKNKTDHDSIEGEVWKGKLLSNEDNFYIY